MTLKTVDSGILAQQVYYSHWRAPVYPLAIAECIVSTEGPHMSRILRLEKTGLHELYCQTLEIIQSIIIPCDTRWMVNHAVCWCSLYTASTDPWKKEHGSMELCTEKQHDWPSTL